MGVIKFLMVTDLGKIFFRLKTFFNDVCTAYDEYRKQKAQKPDLNLKSLLTS